MKQELCEYLAWISVVPLKYVCERKNERAIFYVNIALITYLNPWKSNPKAHLRNDFPFRGYQVTDVVIKFSLPKPI